jgi:carbamoyltransferase
MEAFTFASGLTMTGRRFAKLFNGPPRKAESVITQREMDLARSVQAVTEDVMLRMSRHIHRETGETKLCLAGGVALNCVANGRILREGPFDEIWVQPAAGDAGGSLGAALATWHLYEGKPRTVHAVDGMKGSFLGPEWSPDQIRAFLEDKGIPYEEPGDEELAGRVADLLADGQVVGWLQGRMEFGPRALGGRSILADPRGRGVQRTVNLKIKFRESFRPFAPAVLAEEVSEWFDLDSASPYMLLVASVRDASVDGEGFERLGQIRSRIPAVTHVDGSARVQTVHRETNPEFYRLLEAFRDRTDCPVLVNTSFNVRGEPIVQSPADAWRCFRRTQMDVLVLGPCLVLRRTLDDPDAELLDAHSVAATYGLD